MLNNEFLLVFKGKIVKETVFTFPPLFFSFFSLKFFLGVALCKYKCDFFFFGSICINTNQFLSAENIFFYPLRFFLGTGCPYF